MYAITHGQTRSHGLSSFFYKATDERTNKNTNHRRLHMAKKPKPCETLNEIKKEHSYYLKVPVAERCKRAWENWKENGGDDSVMKKNHIMSQTDVPFEPYCTCQLASVDRVLTEIGVLGRKVA